jgi:hypothetical protein
VPSSDIGRPAGWDTFGLSQAAAGHAQASWSCAYHRNGRRFPDGAPRVVQAKLGKALAAALVEEPVLHYSPR